MRWITAGALALFFAGAPAPALDTLDTSAPAYLDAGTALVPFRPVFEWLGLKVGYDAGTVSATREGSRIELVPGRDRARVDGRSVALPHAPVNVHGTVYVPLRFVAEAVGAEVAWDADARQAIITDGARQAAVPMHPPVYPLVSWVLLGGRANGQWMDAPTLKALIEGDETYHVYTADRHVGTAVGSKVTVDAPGDAHYVTLSPELPDDAVALAAPWDALPRTPRSESTSQQVYVDEVARVLRERGLTQATANITQIQRIDLEGDGQDEVLISATSPHLWQDGELFPPPEVKAGDYTMVLLRKIVDGRARTFVLDGQFYTRDEPFAAPFLFRIGPLLDLDGDGDQEILLDWRYYEGSGHDAFDWQGDEPVRVFSGGGGA